MNSTLPESGYRPNVARYRAALELVLLFYRAGHWSKGQETEWIKRMDFILGEPSKRNCREVGDNGNGTWDGAQPTNEATTKNLCNAVRAALRV